MTSNALAVRVLRILREQGRTVGTPELLQLIEQDYANYPGVRRRLPSIDYVMRTLKDLSGIGLVIEPESGVFELAAYRQDAVGGRGALPSEGSVPPDFPASGGLGGERGGGGGIGEILAHPILFSLEPPAYLAAVNRALGIFE